MNTKFIVVIVLSLCFAGPAMGGWETAIDLNVDIAPYYGDRFDLYTNVDGNHVIHHEGDEITYYLFSYSGSQTRSSTVISNISEIERLAKIGGYGDYVYIVYVKDDTIFTRRSTNAGQTWSTSINNITMTDGSCNELSLYTTDSYLHIAWSEYDDSYEEFDSYHNSILLTADSWGTKKRVTDSSGDYGGFPSVTTSSSRIHVAYTQSDAYSPLSSLGTIKTRDKYSSS